VLADHSSPREIAISIASCPGEAVRLLQLFLETVNVAALEPRQPK
jgi:hypothetical protein